MTSFPSWKINNFYLYLQGSCSAGSTIKYGGCADDYANTSVIFQEPAEKIDASKEVDHSNLDIVKATQFGALNRVKGNY